MKGCYKVSVQIETIYYLENPEDGVKKWVTASQLKYENIIKDVFGVALVSDLPIMIQYNKKFQESICDANHVTTNQISLDMIFRIASKTDLLEYRKAYLADKNSEAEVISPPFDPVIKLNEGIFKWNQNNSSYIQVKTN
jgi:hypothetical protein